MCQKIIDFGTNIHLFLFKKLYTIGGTSDGKSTENPQKALTGAIEWWNDKIIKNSYPQVFFRNANLRCQKSELPRNSKNAK